mgnify:CR=1 FL=1
MEVIWMEHLPMDQLHILWNSHIMWTQQSQSFQLFKGTIHDQHQDLLPQGNPEKQLYTVSIFHKVTTSPTYSDLLQNELQHDNKNFKNPCL